MKKVQIGDNLDIKASTWNAFIDAANFVKGVQSNQSGNTLKNGMFNGLVFIKNMENNTFPQYSALVLNDILISPNKNEAEFKGKIPTFMGCKMTEDLLNKPYAILLEPIESGKIGKALLLGITPAKVNIENETDQFAIPAIDSDSGALKSSSEGIARILWKAGDSGEQWCILQLGGASSGGNNEIHIEQAVLCRILGQTIGNTYFVEVYGNGLHSHSTESGILFVPEIAYGSTLPIGSVILCHKTLLSVVKGSEE